MMMAIPSNHSSIATCPYQKPLGNGISDPRGKKRILGTDLYEKKMTMAGRRAVAEMA
jgi:hypothetical protein